MFAHETARETQFLHLINIHMSVQVHYTILKELKYATH